MTEAGGHDEVVVGIDIATAGVRALALDARGRERGAARAALPAPTAPRPGWSEQDPSAWWPAVARALRTVTGELDGGRVVGVTVSATSGSVVALDGHGAPVGPALHYADQRAADEAERAQAAAHDRWAALGLRIRPSFGLPKWGWLLGREEVAGQAARLAHVSDVVVGRLVGGAPPTDWSHALKSGYDPLRQEWVDPALTALGIPPRLLPEVRPPTAEAGRVGRAAAADTGLPEGCVVRLGMTDSCAAQLAAGTTTPGRFVSVLGTTLVVKGASHELLTDPDGAVYSHRHPDGWWLPGGASSTGAGVLKTEFADRDLSRLDAAAARHGPAGVVRYPLTGRGERFPFAVADAEGFVLGEPSGETDRYRAALEGVAFVERLAYQRLQRLGAPADPPITVTGGGSRSRVWNRIRATVLGMPLRAVPDASTARGACILAAAGGLHPDLASATRAMAAGGDPVEPDPAQTDALAASYERFLAALTDRGWLDQTLDQPQG